MSRNPIPLVAVILAVGAVFLFCPFTSHAEPDFVVIYAPSGSYGCFVSEPEDGGVVSIDVVLYFFGCMEGVEFSVAATDGFTGTYLGETSEWSYMGNAVDGMMVGAPYPDGWTQGEVRLATVQYMTYGTSAPCSRLYAAPHQELGGLRVYDCSEQVYEISAESRWAWVNGVVDCHAWECTPGPVGTEPTTWGRVKALYGN